ncbi:MAG: histidine phosphotransferase family protein [Hyphomonadaceae bacterium]
MIEGTQLAAMVASKICHDLVEPIGALVQGLEFAKGGDAAMREDAMAMIDQGVQKAWAKLDFYRFAVAGAMAEGEGELDEGRETAERLYSALRPELIWSAPSVRLPKRATRVVLNLLLIANECLPRGGAVEVSAAGDGAITIAATGPRAALRPATAAALRGEAPSDGYSGPVAQPLLTGILARQAGVELSARESEERVELVARAAAIRLAA